MAQDSSPQKYTAVGLPWLIAAGIVLTLAGWIGVRIPLDSSLLPFFDNLHWTAGYATGALLATRTWKTSAGNERLIALWITRSLWTLTFGQLIWDGQVVAAWLPFPGPSDLFFLATGVMSTVGLWQVARQQLTESDFRALLLDTLTILTGILCLTLVLYLPRQGTYSVFQLATMLIYAVGFTSPAVLAFTLLLSTRSLINIQVLLLPVTLLLFGACWVEWNLRFLTDQLSDGAWLNLAFSAVAIAIGISTGFFRLDASREPRWERFCDNVIRLMPIFMVACAAVGVMMMVGYGGYSSELENVGVAGALVVVGFAIVRQSYLLRDRDRMLLAEQLVSEREKELEVLNKELESRVERRTLELVDSHRMAALGALVAGISHEMNTPIGNARLVADTLHDELHLLREQIQEGQIRKSAFTEVLLRAENASSMINKNLERAASLVAGFKQIAVDRTAEHRRPFDAGELLQEIIRVQRVVSRHTALRIEVQAEEKLVADSYPGPLGQVLDILIENARLHAFDDNKAGTIRITVESVGDSMLRLTLSDDGKGIPEENISKIFDPFFTTKLGKGGSGLGLHVAWNIVQEVLGGKITVSSGSEHGTSFRIDIPKHAP